MFAPTQFLQDGIAIQPRKHDVEEDEVVMPFGREIAAIRAAVRDIHDVIAFGERPA